jgi:Tol biopolymer transport system component
MKGENMKKGFLSILRSFNGKRGTKLGLKTPSSSMGLNDKMSRIAKSRFKRHIYLAAIGLVIIAVLTNAKAYEITQLTFEPSYEGQPAWSPDGSKIAFVSKRDGNPEIYLMDVDGSNQNRLTYSEPGYCAKLPVWFPNGEKIAYISVYGAIFPEESLNIIDINNGSVAELEKASMLKGHSFSPDGNYIVVSGCSGWDVCAPQIYKINLNTNERTFLGEGIEPTWSPDGSEIAFASHIDENWDIYIIDTNGTQKSRLTSQSTVEKFPAWSPDENYMAFCSKSRDVGGGNFNIYTTNPLTGRGRNRITESLADDVLTWSPNASKIAFESNGDIWVVSNDDIWALPPFGLPIRTSDFNNDWIVNLRDFATFANYWLQRKPLVDIAPDCGDGIIDFSDLAKLAEEWLKMEPWYPPP